jgi:hypothetical protein
VPPGPFAIDEPVDEGECLYRYHSLPLTQSRIVHSVSAIRDRGAYWVIEY